MPLAPKPPVLRSVRQRRRRFEGFTLLELMIVVAIIGITAALAAPAIMRAMAISRADRANHDVMRLVRFARSQSLAYGRAYLVHMASGGTGRAELWEGTTSACRLQDWAAIQAIGTCSVPNSPTGNCVDFVDTAQYAVDVHTVSIDSGGVDLCFQPNGDMLTRTSSSSGAWALPPTGFVQITTLRYEGTSTPVDPPRGVMIPIGGAPRALR